MAEKESVLEKWKVLRGSKLYSFDMFDTLVTRITRRPSDVFSLVALSGVVRYRFPFFSLVPFRVWRIFAEKLSRKFSSNEDVTIFEVYRVLGFFIKQPAQVLRRELEIEFRVIRPMPENVDRLRSLIRDGNECCIISDMYLPVTVIRRLVRLYIGDVAVYVSSACKVTKSSGQLFEYVRDVYGVNFSEITHYGDNLVSDIKVPALLGVNVVDVGRFHSAPGRGVYEYFKCHVNRSEFFRIGYELAGPASLAFAKFVRNETRCRGIERVLFGARDTYLVKKAYDLLYPGSFTRYVRISRRAVYIPEVAVSGDMARLFEGVSKGRDFFERLGLDCPSDLLDISPVRNSQLFIKVLEESDFLSSIARVELDDFRHYLLTNGFSGSVAFVDIGWRGSIQDSLDKISAGAFSLIGFYFGTTSKAENKKGFFFEKRKPYKRFFSIFQALPVFEFIFTEPVLSLKKVKRKGADFYFEYISDETDVQVSSRAEIQAGAEAFLNDYMSIADLMVFDSKICKNSLDYIFRKNLLHPTDAMVKAFSSVSHSAGFGGSLCSLAVGLNVSGFLDYLKSPWKAAYIKMIAMKEEGIYFYFVRSFLFSWPFFCGYEYLKSIYRWGRRYFVVKVNFWIKGVI